MCPPSSRAAIYGKMKPRNSFDTKSKSLHLNHKFTTADKAQVCDGRNWESCRNGNSVPEAVDSPNKKNKVHPVAAPKKISNNSNSSDESVKAFIDKVHRLSKSGAPPPQDRAAKRATGSDDSMKRIMSSYKPRRSSRTNLSSLGAQEQQTEQKEHRQDDAAPTVRKQTKRPSLEDILADADKASGVQKGSNHLGSSTDDSSASLHVPSVPPKREGANTTRRSSSSSRRRHSSSSNSNTIRSSRSSDERRRGSAGRRRHSNEDKISTSSRLPRKSGKPTRRQSLDSNTSSIPSRAALAAGGGESSSSRVTVRKLSEPMHRCSMTNQNTKGIMRPARYSSNNLAAMSNNGSFTSGGGRSSPPQTPEKTREGYQSVRRASAETHPPNFLESLGLSAELGSGRSRSTSADDLDKYSKNGSSMRRNTSMVDMQTDNAKWVAHGVEFSKSMEVYLFHK